MRVRGFEPPRPLRTREPESSASASSASWLRPSPAPVAVDPLVDAFRVQGTELPRNIITFIKGVLHHNALLRCIVGSVFRCGPVTAVDDAIVAEYDGLTRIRDVTLWVAVAVTIFSGVEYSIRAVQMLRRAEPPDGPQDPSETPSDDTTGN